MRLSIEPQLTHPWRDAPTLGLPSRADRCGPVLRAPWSVLQQLIASPGPAHLHQRVELSDTYSESLLTSEVTPTHPARDPSFATSDVRSNRVSVSSTPATPVASSTPRPTGPPAPAAPLATPFDRRTAPPTPALHLATPLARRSEPFAPARPPFARRSPADRRRSTATPASTPTAGSTPAPSSPSAGAASSPAAPSGPRRPARPSTAAWRRGNRGRRG